MNRKKPTNKDYGRRHYVSDDDYQTAMRRVPDKAMYNEHVIKQSEFKKPYRKDSETYEEMEYHYPDFNLSIPSLDWPQPNADVEGEVPGEIWSIETLLCNWELCYCKGQTKCFDYWCTFPIVKAWFDDPNMGVSFSGNQICIDASPDVYGGQWLNYILKFFHTGIVAGKRVTKTSFSNQFSHVWECNSSECCGCTGISIGYTTQQMAVSTQQTLTVVGAVEGCTYDWAIASGGGSLSSSTGTSVVYTAPDTNAECALNPIITLSCDGTQCDSLQIAVNAVTGTTIAVWKCCTAIKVGATNYRCYNYSYCSGGPYSGWVRDTDPMKCLADCGELSGSLAYNTCAGMGYYEGIADLRTAEMKTAGCCPMTLL